MLTKIKILNFSPMRGGGGGGTVAKAICAVMRTKTCTIFTTNNPLTDSRRLYAKFKPNQYNHTTNNYNNGEYNAEKRCDESYKTNVRTDGRGCCYGRVQADGGDVLGLSGLAGYQQPGDGFSVGNETADRQGGGRASSKTRCCVDRCLGYTRVEWKSNKLFVGSGCSGAVLWSTN